MPGGRNLECPAKNSGYFLAIHNKIIVDKTMSFSDAEKGDTALPSPRGGSFPLKDLICI